MRLAIIALLITASACAAEPIPGLAFLTPDAGDVNADEAAARDLALSLGASELALAPPGALTIPADCRVIWWHCARGPLPGAMLAAPVREALLAWLNRGHGLFLTGTALSYVTSLGVEPASPRSSSVGGVDGVVAGLDQGDSVGHPLFAGFPPDRPIPLVSGGYPPFADFWGTGGPLGGIQVGKAWPDSGENPVAEYAPGPGRILCMSWRLPHYALAPNTYRANLERLTANALRYLGGGKWFGQITDARLRMLRVRLAMLKPEAMALAIRDLMAAFPGRYTNGPRYVSLLDSIPATIAALEADEPGAADRAAETLDTLTRAMLDNPYLDFASLLLVRRSEGNLGLPANWQSNSSLSPVGYDNELCVLSPVSPDGELRTVYQPPEGRFIGDVDLDFDASRLIFSMPAGNHRWQVFEMPLGGGAPSALPLITEPDVDNYDACYLPDGNLLFTSTASFVGVPCVTGADHVSNLFRYDRASGAIRQLTFDQDHAWCPTPLPDGRVLYLRWEYSDIPHYVSRILFTMNPDGTNQAEFYGSNSYWPNAMFYARPLPGSSTRFATVVGGHHDNPRMGELVLFDRDQGRREADGVIQRIPGRGEKVEPTILDGLTAASWPKFLHPYPLSDHYFLTACKPTPGTPWGLYLADVFDNLTLIKELPGSALLEPLPLRSAPRPPVIPSRVDTSRRDATVLLTDIYAGDGLKGIPRGTIKSLRLLSYHFAYHGMGGQVNRVGLDGPWDVKRIVGTVPVSEDGSAYFSVPANTPISIQPLDASGQALQLMRSWMTAMPGESVSCVGCHEPQSRPPSAAVAAASRRVPEAIRPWYGPARGFSFQREVQPVLDRHCISCHNGREGKDLPDFTDAPEVYPPGPDTGYKLGSHFTPSYLALKRYVRGHTIESDIHLLTPGEFSADTTRLVQLLRAGHHGVVLGPEDWDRLITWIDLNTPAHGTWHEIVGEGPVNHFRDRRREMLTRYANRDEDPEAVYPVSYTPPPDSPASASASAPAVSLASAVSPDRTLASWGAAVSSPGRQPGALAASSPSLSPGGAADALPRSVILPLAASPAPAVSPGGAADALPLTLVRVPAGEFVSGDGRPIAIAAPFWMARCEITNALFRAFDATHDSRLETGDFLQFGIAERGWPTDAPDQPVCRVSAERAEAFCAWLSRLTGLHFALPSEDQWEWACRAGTTSPLWFGDLSADFSPFANLADARLQAIENIAPWSLPRDAIAPWRPAVTTVDDGYRVSAPVGHYQPNAWGLCDMAGNVAEWTASSPESGTATDRVVRGGSWYDMPSRATSSSRQVYPAYRAVYDVGFRVICTD